MESVRQQEYSLCKFQLAKDTISCQHYIIALSKGQKLEVTTSDTNPPWEV